MTQLTDTSLKRLTIRKKAREMGELKFHDLFITLPISKQKLWSSYEDAKFYCFETTHYTD